MLTIHNTLQIYVNDIIDEVAKKKYRKLHFLLEIRSWLLKYFLHIFHISVFWSMNYLISPPMDKVIRYKEDKYAKYVTG